MIVTRLYGRPPLRRRQACYHGAVTLSGGVPPLIAANLAALGRAGARPPTEAITALVDAGEDAVSPLLDALAGVDPDEDDWTPLWITVTLGELRSPRAVPALLELLELPDGDVLAEAAIEALARIGPQALPGVCAFARRAPGWEARACGYGALGLIPGEASLRFLVEALHRDVLLWSAIAIALADLGDPRALPALHALLPRCETREAEPVREAIAILEGRQPPYPNLLRRPWRDRYAGLLPAL